MGVLGVFLILHKAVDGGIDTGSTRTPYRVILSY